MCSRITSRARDGIMSILVGLVALSAPACARGSATGSSSGSSAEAVRSGETKPDGGEMWSQNCERCHNIRPSRSFSDPQWEVIVHHMRIRAGLTAKESRAIVEYLKSSN